ncbi:Oxysterol-binding protein-related protein 1C [Sesamum angolense]|uniref:Oxysterol-binding protein-related protein 1C n=1 Tax=Sesamum angolense TaxID=2727404 RepID=A0AAE2BJ37_9LAMI|nr:Oxysterol-binding protein-related protein 1C [Sesamum angolense]
MTMNSNSHMPPADPLNKSQNSAMSRVPSTRYSLPDHISVGAPVNNNIHHQNNHSRELKIDIVGNGISGILYKWVNYGKGWRPRWFVLQDGVLSYYKIHGPDKIVVNQETEKGSRVIGEESMRRIARQHNNYHHHHNHHRNGNGGSSSKSRKPVGEVHLKVSSIRESKSDDRRFSIFTGTKRLHLRADSREDRVAWMEALQTVKDMFPRMSNSELMAPVDNVAVSTERLRQRLSEEGLSEAAIQDSEQIMRNEFASLQNQLMLLKQKYWLLMDTLRQLEKRWIWKRYESQRQLKDVGSSSRSRQDKYSESASESEDENERVDAVEEDTDEEDNTFFDTRDFLSSSSFKSNGSDFRTSSFSSDDDELYAFDAEDSIDPAISQQEQAFLTLNKCFEDLEYSYLIDRAYEWGKQTYSDFNSFEDLRVEFGFIYTSVTLGNSLMRILNVAAFAVSGYASTEGRNCKPFNPLLGETYEADYPDKGLRFVSEKVSHHPMIVACHCKGTGWRFYADSNLKSKFWGRSIQLDPVGMLTLEFDDGEVFQWSKVVTTSIYNLILGKLYCDHYGTMRIQGNRNYSCKLKFKEQSIIDRNPHQVQGIVQDKSGKTVATLFGKWDESMHYVNGDCSSKGKGHESLSEAHLLWKRSKPPKFPTRYNFTRFAMTLNELIPGLKMEHELSREATPTDSRLRPDQRCLENGEYEMANAEKLRLEQRQRQARKMQESGWKPRWFAKDKGSETYRYVGGYWEAREEGKWDACPDIFGQIPSDQISDE